MNVESIKGKKALPVVDIDKELAAFEAEERKRLNIADPTEQWVEDMANLTFTKTEKGHITILVSGLTMAHDHFVEGALKGVGYNVQALDCPDVAALQFGKEFGNRGQCNPTYFTVGNLVKFLSTMRDKHGMTSQEVINKYVFLTAGACGPCRFGMYVTEFRKALRDAGLRRLPRHAVPANRRAVAGHGRGQRPRDEPDVLLGARQGPRCRRRAQCAGVPHPSLRGDAG
jgi:hypothetical protein